MRLTFTRHPNQSLLHRAGSRAGRIGLFVLCAIALPLNEDRVPVMHQPAEQGPGRSAVSLRNFDGLSTPQIRVGSEWTGVVTASGPIKRPLRLPRRSADGPTSQVRNAITTTPITIIKRTDEPTSGAPKNGGGSSKGTEKRCKIVTRGVFPGLRDGNQAVSPRFPLELDV